MGVILDSSILVTAERQGNNARQMLAAVSSQFGNTEIALSVITLLELAHGAARSDHVGEKSNTSPVHRRVVNSFADSSRYGDCSFAHRTDRRREPGARRKASAR